MLKILFLLGLTLTIITFCSPAHSLEVEFTEQVPMVGIKEVGCDVKVTVIIDSDIKGHEFRKIKESKHKNLCLEDHINVLMKLESNDSKINN